MDTSKTKDRFKDIEWASQIKDCTLGGLGGINSWVALYLGRIGHSIIGYDMDIVEDVNIAGQHYGNEHIGASKSRATRDILVEYCGHYDYLVLNEFTEDSDVTAYCFSGFDNMAARKLMFEKWKEIGNDNKIFIDGRLLAESGQIYFVTKGMEEQYEETLFEDSLVEPVQCTAKATTHCGAMIASLIVAGFNNHICNTIHETIVRPLPFSMEFHLPTLSFEQTIKKEKTEECIITQEDLQV